ncbi:MAG TPA: hypothetical protein VKZ51_10065 [Cyclobacteriaceae bacterium]|nr:hypothetical protein [Cyclobacteriaceae bacterium]
MPPGTQAGQFVIISEHLWHFYFATDAQIIKNMLVAAIPATFML